MFENTYPYAILKQRFGEQRLRRQPEMDSIMMDREQDLQYSRDGQDGALAVLYEFIIHVLLRRAPATGEALDVATGSGQLLAKLAAALPGVRFLATDLSPHMLSLAEGNARRAGAANVETKAHSMFDLETLGRGPFDLITWCFAAHHSPTADDAVRALDGMARLLKPGGTLFVFDIQRPKTGDLAVAFADRYNQTQGAWYYQDSLDSYKAAFTFGEFRRALERSSLKNWVHVDPRLGNFFQMVLIAATRRRDAPARPPLPRLWQRRDYALMRLGFAGRW